MIVGDRKSFAIESSITQTFPSLGQRALGYFVVHIRGKSYGVQKQDASMLGCSFEGVNDRLRRRGTHRIPFLSTIDAPSIAEAFLDAIYRETERIDYFGLPNTEFSDILHKSSVAWAPDGDEAFDDGSCVLQFDVENKVRLIAFVNAGSPDEVATTIVEEWLDVNLFYDVLSRWSELFAAEWTTKFQENSSNPIQN
jgi:hypothetical protein